MVPISSVFNFNMHSLSYIVVVVFDDETNISEWQVSEYRSMWKKMQQIQTYYGEYVHLASTEVISSQINLV